MMACMNTGRDFRTGSCRLHGMACSAVLLAMMGLQLGAQAQTSASGAPAVAAAPRQEQQTTQPVNPTTAARFIEDCNDAMERGVASLGCQAPLYRNELERLKREAVTTQNPQLLSFVGDAYRNPRSGLGDMGQAYRWYLMAAVRGDPQAMQRLADMNRKGIGVPKDNVKAMGYARLVQRMSQPGAAQPNVVSIINELGDEMAVEEVALAERFAGQLQERILRESGAGQSGGGSDAGGAPSSLTIKPDTSSVPGMPQPAAAPRTPSPAPPPGAVLPGVPAPLAPSASPAH